MKENRKSSTTSVVSELEGSLLKGPDPFSYYMLVAFEASGLFRFGLLLLFWPLIFLLNSLQLRQAALRVTAFVATAGVPLKKIEAVGRTVLPKFYLDDLDMEAWKVFSSYDKKVVVTEMPRVMVERFVKEHLHADEVVGSTELVVSNRFGLALGMVRICDVECIEERLKKIFGAHIKPSLGMGRIQSSFLLFCEDQFHSPFEPIWAKRTSSGSNQLMPSPVIFHDGRLVKRPTAPTALMILLWIPFGIFFAIIRILMFVILGVQNSGKISPYILDKFGIKVTVKGKPPPSCYIGYTGGVLYALNHRTVMDSLIVSCVLRRKVPVVSYSASPLLEAISPIRSVRLSRDRKVDSQKIKEALKMGDLMICPEGTTCREPFLLRFSALFVELTDSIVPLAVDCKLGWFYATTASGWKALDPVFFNMNPRPTYELTFLDQLNLKENSSRSSYDVANDLQTKVAEALGFECTQLTRKDKYRLLAGNDGSVSQGGGGEKLMWFEKQINQWLEK